MNRHFAVKLASLIFLAASMTAAQSTLPRRGIPSIVQSSDGAIVSIVMSDKDGEPIAQGTGFLVSRNGLILTNYHVIKEGTNAVVKLPDGAFYVVDGIVASNKKRDIALIKAHGENFRTLTLGNSDRVEVGQEVVAIGNPLSLESTVSNGIISGVRTDEDLGGTFLQVTAPISPGSSGGPLFNMDGQVVGITTMYLKGGENLNFAIPINDAKSLLDVESSKLQDFPNEPDATTLQEQTHAQETSPSEPVAAAEAPVSARDYYQQLFRAGGFSGGLPSYVCFSDDPHSTTFFTFRAYAYDADYYDAQAKLPTFEEKMASGSDIVTPAEKKQFDIMDARQRTAPYVTFLMKGWLESFSPNAQQFFRSGGRILEESVYDKGVKTNTLEYHWDGNSWFLQIPPADPNAYTRTSKVLRLSIEPSTMRYVDLATETITVGSGETAATDTASYGPWPGVCEKVPNPNSAPIQTSSRSTVADPFPPLKSAPGAQNATAEVQPGLYQSDDDDTRYFLRLYSDGTVIEVATTSDATPDDVERWFHRPYRSSGTYQIQGSAIQFSIQSPEGAVGYQGQIQGTVLTLDSFSHINGYRGHKVYHLVGLGR